MTISNPKPVPPPSLPAPYCDSFRYTMDNHGIVTFWFGREVVPAILDAAGRVEVAGEVEWHAAAAISINLAIDLHQKLGENLANAMRLRGAHATAEPTQLN